MTHLLKYFLITVLSCVSGFLLSQNQYSKWYYGNKAAIDFMTNPPTPLFNSTMAAAEGSSSIADASGNLLFYTDGIKVWNQQHVLMANGTGLLGSYDATQAALIVKKPGSQNIYYIFTVDNLGNPNGLRYTTVDMSLAAGMGSVTVKNTLLYTPTTERMCGVRHCNGTDVWVITHDYPGNTFYSYHVSSSGVSATATLSSVSAAFTSSVNTMGILKASYSGRKLVTNFNVGNQLNSFELYDFDNATGAVSNPLQFNREMIDAEFSEDGTKLYLTSLTPANTFCILQFNLCAGNTSAIEATVYSIPTGSLCFRMQTAINGKIYITDVVGQSLSCINNPNAVGAACGYTANAISVSPNSNNAGVPAFVTERKPPSFVVKDAPAGCNAFSFEVANCPILNVAIQAYAWTFGDPASGLANTSNLSMPTHTYTGPGTYTAKLICYTPCGADTVFQTVVVGTTSVAAASKTICSGQSATLTALGNITYTWSNGQNASTINVAPTVNTTYTVQGTSQLGCINSTTLSVFVNPVPSLHISGNASVCPGELISLGASGATTYTWNTSQQGPAISFSPTVAGTYTVYGKNNFGCIAQQTISTFIFPLPLINTAGTTTLCPGATVTQTASGALTYNWSNGATASIVTLSPLSNSIYTVSGYDFNGCSGTKTVLISLVTVPPQTTFSYTSLCEKSGTIIPVKHSAFNEGGVFSSPELVVNAATGDVDPNSPSGVYFIKYATQASGCFAAGSGTAALTILPVLPLNLSSQKNVAPNSSAVISVSGGNSYTWTPDDYLSCTDCANPVTSPLNNIQYCVVCVIDGCKSEACIDIIVSCETGNDFSLPNAFTPDGDGINDLFCLQGWEYCVSKFQIRIFNRWGEMVFSSEDKAFCWDGFFKGELLNSDVFVYTVNAVVDQKGKISKRGNISLIR